MKPDFHKIKSIAIRPIYVAPKPLSAILKKDQLMSYITLQAVSYIKAHHPGLEVVEYKFQKSPTQLRDLLMASIITRPETNHPFVVFAIASQTTVYIVKPFGKNRRGAHINMDDYKVFGDQRHLRDMTRAEYYAILTLLTETIRIRRTEIIESNRFSLLKCENIKPCMARYRAIQASQVSPERKMQELAHWKLYYEKKAIHFLSHYFTLLNNRRYKEAYLFLKGEQLYGKQSLTAFFYKSDGFIGHLEIFISIYELMHNVIDCIVIANTP